MLLILDLNHGIFKSSSKIFPGNFGKMEFWYNAFVIYFLFIFSLKSSMIHLMTKVQRELKTVEKHSLQVQTLEMKTGVRTLVLKYTIELKEKKTTGIFSLLFQTFLIQILEKKIKSKRVITKSKMKMHMKPSQHQTMLSIKK